MSARNELMGMLADHDEEIIRAVIRLFQRIVKKRRTVNTEAIRGEIDAAAHHNEGTFNEVRAEIDRKFPAVIPDAGEAE